MKHFFSFLLIFSFFTINNYAQPANDNCANATNLAVNVACISGTTEQGTVQGGEVTTPSCAAGAFNQTVWYKFTATATHMYVQLNLTTFGGSGATWGPGYWTCVVYNSSSCIPTSGSIISCQNCNSQGNADGVIANEMFGLTVGSTYMVQIGYRTGMGVNLIPNYCIKVSDQFTPDCNTCANPCGPACGFVSQPTAAQVTANCPGYPQNQFNEGGVIDTQCYTFNAINDTADFQVIVNSTCGAGNVSNFTWNLYKFGQCGAGPIQSGNLSNLKFTNLTIGQGYVFCYTLTVPTGCYHTQYWPYFIGATPLPIELLSFTGEREKGLVTLRWSTATELNNDHFDLQRSSNQENFITIGTVQGAGNSSVVNNYLFNDLEPLSGINYYRLQQVDFDGKTTTYPVVGLRFDSNVSSLYPNPVNEFSNLSYTSDKDKSIDIRVFDAVGKMVYSTGQQVKKGENEIHFDVSSFSNGIYYLRISDEFSTDHIRFTKN